MESFGVFGDESFLSRSRGPTNNDCVKEKTPERLSERSQSENHREMKLVVRLLLLVFHFRWAILLPSRCRIVGMGMNAVNNEEKKNCQSRTTKRRKKEVISSTQNGSEAVKRNQFRRKIEMKLWGFWMITNRIRLASRERIIRIHPIFDAARRFTLSFN